MHIDRRLALICIAIGSIVVLAGCGAAATITTPVSPSSTSAADAAAASAAAAAQAASDAAAQASSDAAASAAASLAAIPTPVPPTDSQQQAMDSAASYLSEGTGFSRNGLIQQLDSAAGEGFPKADAIYGVDAQGADWNAQAVLSAASYLGEGTGFSRNGLIQQLDSSAEGFTKAQATHGVDAQGADWNAQAVLSAQTYLNDGMGFSRNELIQQLDSSAEGFTKAQATYGVTQAMG
jgi:acyl-CoA synthetase (AMP-forming)/AMP-acid ligase II